MRIDRPQDCLGVLGKLTVDAEYEPVGMQRVLDRKALAEELRIPRQRDIDAIRRGVADAVGQTLGGADRDG